MQTNTVANDPIDRPLIPNKYMIGRSEQRIFIYCHVSLALINKKSTTKSRRRYKSHSHLALVDQRRKPQVAIAI